MNITVDVTVREDGSYGLRNTISNISEAAPVLGTALTLWGVPADPSHDAAADGRHQPPPTPAGVPPQPFLTNPTDCTPGARTDVAEDRDVEPARPVPHRDRHTSPRRPAATSSRSSRR